MQALIVLQNAERVLYQLGHEKDVKKLDKTKIRLSELHDVLPESQGRAWRTIREMVDRGKVGRLEELDKEGRAKIAFLRCVRGLSSYLLIAL
jgi:hypothetical protein